MTFIHKLADVADCQIGEGSTIWQFVVIMEGANIGKNCNICAQSLIESDVVIGDDVTIKSGVQVWDGARIGNNVFIGPNVTFTNDIFPRSKMHPQKYMGIILKKNSSIGANATLLAGVTIGEYSMVGAGSVVTKDVPPNSVVIGNPAKVIRKVFI